MGALSRPAAANPGAAVVRLRGRQQSRVLDPSIGVAIPPALVGVFRLDPATFVRIATQRAHHEALVAAAVVFAAGLSGAVGQSIVLFANRVRPWRFVASLFADSLLFVFGFAFLVVSTWSVARLADVSGLSIRPLALVLALAYAPLLLGFLTAVPYLGPAIGMALRLWHLLAMVVGVGAVAAVGPSRAIALLAVGWLVGVAVQHSVGKPVALLGRRLLDAVAGVPLHPDPQTAVADAVGSATIAPTRARAARRSVARSSVALALIGLGSIALLAILVSAALGPVRSAIFGWAAALPAVLALPFDLAWLLLIAVLVTGFVAPLETLGWWAGWSSGDFPVAAGAVEPGDRAVEPPARFVVYLDGIAQSSARYTPDIETFLDALTARLPPRMALVRGVMAYSVINRPLDDDPLFSRFWRFVEARRIKHTASLLGWFVNLRNVLVVGVSADPRYGPIYNFGIAKEIYRALRAAGYRERSATPVTLVGYSGGGQMACGCAAFLKKALGAPVDVISLGGVISGTDPILSLEQLYHLVGTKDGVARLGPIMFASRWRIAVLSNWNRARRLGCITEHSLGPVGHQVPGGMLDPNARLPDGRTHLEATLATIDTILEGRMPAPDVAVVRASNYARYAAAAPALAPGVAPGPGFRAVAPWVGRLVLPPRDARVDGCWFDIWCAPPEYAALRGRTVRLTWKSSADVQRRRRAALRDVNFSARARYAARYGGIVMPTRLNRWRLVDPLESLAGARPLDDTVVRVVDAEFDPVNATLYVGREPVQTTGAYYGLVRFVAPLDAAATRWHAVHYAAGARDFSGAAVELALPPIVPDRRGLRNAIAAGLDASPLNHDGWYVYGGADASGTFVVQALIPRALLAVEPQRRLPDAASTVAWSRKRAWRTLASEPGTVDSVADAVWSVGDRALLVHTYGGIADARARRRHGLYFGHFAYGVAEVVHDPIADEPRFELVYDQLYAQNEDGITAGAQHCSRYLGDRQFGWGGIRPVCDALIRAPRVDELLDALRPHLEAAAARYRVGDGFGGVFVGPARNCSQDSDRALLAALREPSVAGPLAAELRRRLNSAGYLAPDLLDRSVEDAPLATLFAALASWRSIVPRVAFATVLRAFARHGASLRVQISSQVGGRRDDVRSIVPFPPW